MFKSTSPCNTTHPLRVAEFWARKAKTTLRSIDIHTIPAHPTRRVDFWDPESCRGPKPCSPLAFLSRRRAEHAVFGYFGQIQRATPSRIVNSACWSKCKGTRPYRYPGFRLQVQYKGIPLMEIQILPLGPCQSEGVRGLPDISGPAPQICCNSSGHVATPTVATLPRGGGSESQKDPWTHYTIH